MKLGNIHSNRMRVTAISVLVAFGANLGFVGTASAYDPDPPDRCDPDAHPDLQCCGRGDPGWPDGCFRVNTGQTDDVVMAAGGDDCLGACGPGCSPINCGGGGACYDHDVCVRSNGLFHPACDVIFPWAALQWAACVTGRAVVGVFTVFKHIVTGIIGGIVSGILKIFN